MRCNEATRISESAAYLLTPRVVYMEIAARKINFKTVNGADGVCVISVDAVAPLAVVYGYFVKNSSQRVDLQVGEIVGSCSSIDELNEKTRQLCGADAIDCWKEGALYLKFRSDNLASAKDKARVYVESELKK